MGGFPFNFNWPNYMMIKYLKVLEQLEESFGGYFLFGLGLILDEGDDFPDIGDGESVSLTKLFGRKYGGLYYNKNYLLLLIIPDILVFNDIDIMYLYLILNLFFMLYFAPEYLR